LKIIAKTVLMFLDIYQLHFRFAYGIANI